jgi:hypothetical protein
VVEAGGEGNAGSEFLGELVSDVQSQAGAARLPRAVILRPEEFRKQFGFVAGRDADAGIANTEFSALLRLGDAQGNAAVMSVFNGVGKEILENFAQFRFARNEIAERGRKIEF